MMAVVVNAFVLLWSVPILLLTSVLSLGQFKIIFSLASDQVAKRHGSAVWTAARPYLERLIRLLESSFGPAHKFSPSATQVVLVALILALLFSVERVLEQLKANASMRQTA
ncbi:hypothetical protein WJX72_011832 [[Myrmecia] bisecta]|uniref:Uncharacterized protein n=1 Tax=[Myrmecia] bisecta TaxID=41462 RepID=A0AAW1Q4L8_9CHLO